MGQDELLELIERAAVEGWTELDLAGMGLREIPAEIGKLVQLETLILGKFKGWDFVDSELVPKLVTNELTVLPPEVAGLKNLKKLDLSGNHFGMIPQVVFELTQLHNLALVSIDLPEIPEAIGNLTSLTSLHLSSNQITQIPEAIGNLTSLTSLHLSSNQITQIPEAIGNLTSLTSLHLSSNQITQIPEAIGNLTSLTSLHLSSNQITQIPEAIGNLTSLTSLHLSSNQITQIPEAIGNLTSLTSLHLSSNQITQIPEAIGNLTSLTSLHLSSNQITQIPEAIGNLTSLTSLHLWSNQITQIPEAIGNLTSLTSLHLWSNQITQIPEAIGNLTSLTSLHLRSNQITQIPEAIGNLTSLTSLHLRSNQITQIPEAIGNLTSLTSLHLSSNQITQIPEAIGNLTSLTSLHLSSNQITQIPEAIGNLTSLTSLDFENNRITKLSEILLRLPKLENLDLRGNPIAIPPDILAPPAEENFPDARPILDYYFSTQDPEETTQLYEVKILIVGEGGSGKTSLANKLLDADYELPPEISNQSTEGIDILRWEFVGRNHQTYRVHIWDFGGQEIYHQTHQFFLTERSLYLLVADSRKEDTDHYFWLQTIQLLSDGSPVLLIQNEKQNRTCNLNLRELRAEFDNLTIPKAINLADNRGLEEIKNTIQRSLEELLPQGMAFPNSWLKVRYTLENDGRNYISYSEYKATCRSHGIDRPTEILSLSHFLHSLGICLHFQKDSVLRHRLILKPNWGTTSIYKILDDKKVQKNLGQFCDQDLCNIWKAEEYANMHHELLQLMKEFKVCYEIPRRKGNYIAPHLLSTTPCNYDWDEANTQNLILRYQYKSLLPKGILTRFIVEMHQFIENVSEPDLALVWKNGVVLSQGRTRAEIIERPNNREIRIRLSGSQQRDFLAILNNEFYKIHSSYDRLEYDTLIPCNCPTCKTTTDPYAYTFDDLKRYLDHRRSTIECRTSFEQVNVRRLLDDSIDLNFDRKFHKGDHEQELRLREEIRDRSATINIYNIPTAEVNAVSQESQDTYNFQGAVGNFAKEVKDNARQQSIQHNHQAPSQNLTQAAQEIKDLLNQLDTEYDRTTPTGQANIQAKAIEAIDKNPTLKTRTLNALKEGGVAALEEAIDHPVAKVIAATFKGFIDVK